MKCLTQHNYQSAVIAGGHQPPPYCSGPVRNEGAQAERVLGRVTKSSVTRMDRVYGGRTGRLLLPAERVWDSTTRLPAKGSLGHSANWLVLLDLAPVHGSS